MELAELEPSEPEVTAQVMPNAPPARKTAAAPSPAFFVHLGRPPAGGGVDLGASPGGPQGEARSEEGESAPDSPD